MLFFRHVGKTSLIPSPAGGLTAAIVAVVRRRKEYHVVAAVEGHELKTPETKHRPGLERLLETTHLELDGKLVAACLSPDGSARDGTQRGEYSKGEPAAFVLSCAQGGWMRLQ
jgi:hypothetical protein